MEAAGRSSPWRRKEDASHGDEGLKEGAKPFLELRGGAVARRKQDLQGREERTGRGSCAGERRRGSAWGSCEASPTRGRASVGELQIGRAHV